MVNEHGELLNFTLTPGNTDDRKPVTELLYECFGKVFADGGEVSKKLAGQFLEDFGITFFAKRSRNMKNQLMRLTDKLMSRKRSIIETIIDQFKNISQIEHSRASQPHQFSGQCRLWVDCLLSPALQALSQYTLGFTPCCLTRTDVKKVLNLTWRLGFRIHEVQSFYLTVINKALYGQNHCLLPRKNSHNQPQQAKARSTQKSSKLA